MSKAITFVAGAVGGAALCWLFGEEIMRPVRWFLCFIGIVVLIFVVGYLVALLQYRWFVEELKKPARDCGKVIDRGASTDGFSMPILHPLPLPTRKDNSWIQTLRWLCESRKWKVHEEWYHTTDALEGGKKTIVIPKNFVFDGASVPRLFWSLFTPAGLLLVPGLIHDYAYQCDKLWIRGRNGDQECYSNPTPGERCSWDRLFYAIGVEANNGLSFLHYLATLAVYVGGGSTWNRYRAGNK